MLLGLIGAGDMHGLPTQSQSLCIFPLIPFFSPRAQQLFLTDRTEEGIMIPQGEGKKPAPLSNHHSSSSVRSVMVAGDWDM
jgi:hypothetical protein